MINRKYNLQNKRWFRRIRARSQLWTLPQSGRIHWDQVGDYLIFSMIQYLSKVWPSLIWFCICPIWSLILADHFPVTLPLLHRWSLVSFFSQFLFRIVFPDRWPGYRGNSGYLRQGGGYLLWQGGKSCFFQRSISLLSQVVLTVSNSSSSSVGVIQVTKGHGLIAHCYHAKLFPPGDEGMWCERLTCGDLQRRHPRRWAPVLRLEDQQQQQNPRRPRLPPTQQQWVGGQRTKWGGHLDLESRGTLLLQGIAV